MLSDSYLLEPVTQCFSDPEPRVRYYACESLFNIAKVARQSILKHSFNEIFAGCVRWCQREWRRSW